MTHTTKIQKRLSEKFFSCQAEFISASHNYWFSTFEDSEINSE
ncbi:hypothetical protein FORMB_06130 [Formosa sp. Hel1_33_131]|nr:hypothetical protein FORMB_06130 [Formosa sp. Hel1_33_131]